MKHNINLEKLFDLKVNYFQNKIDINSTYEIIKREIDFGYLDNISNQRLYLMTKHVMNGWMFEKNMIAFFTKLDVDCAYSYFWDNLGIDLVLNNEIAVQIKLSLDNSKLKKLIKRWNRKVKDKENYIFEESKDFIIMFRHAGRIYFYSWKFKEKIYSKYFGDYLKRLNN